MGTKVTMTVNSVVSLRFYKFLMRISESVVSVTFVPIYTYYRFVYIVSFYIIYIFYYLILLLTYIYRIIILLLLLLKSLLNTRACSQGQ